MVDTEPIGRPRRRRLTLSACMRLGAIALALLGPGRALADGPAPQQLAHLAVGMPKGFDDLAARQHAVVDIHFGDRRIGQAAVEFEPGQVRLVDANAVIAMLPEILDPAAVRSALAAPGLAANADRVCSEGSDRQRCGRLEPDVAGVIFDADRFRLALFVNPRFLRVRDAVDTTYLPRPDASLSLVDSIAGTIAGGRGGPNIYAIQNRAVLGDRDARIVSMTSYASGLGFKGDVLAAQVDKPGVRYTAGAFWSGGIDLLGRRKLLGVGVETQFDTRFDKDLLTGSPLIVALPQRSRVDLIVDGRLMSSRTYEAGNQRLDTSGMPDGAYDVVLHIQEMSGQQRQERRFFTKNPRIAPMGKTLAFARGGVLVNDQASGFMTPTRSPYLEAGIGRRLTQHLAIDTTLVATDERAVVEVGGHLISSLGQVRLAALASSRGDTGLLFQANSLGTSRLNFNFDLRRIDSRDNRPLVPTGGLSSRDIAGFQTAQVAAGSYTQLIGDVSYRLNHAQIGFSGFYRQDAGRKSAYAIGPTARWSVFQRRGLDVTFEANLSQSNVGRSSYVGVRLQLLRARMSVSATTGAQAISSDVEGRRSAIVGGVQAAWQRENVLGGDLMLAGSLDHTADVDLAHARADLRGPMGAVAADIMQQTNGPGGAQYSLGFQTGLVVNKAVLKLGGRGDSDSVIAVRLKDAPAQATFEVFVDDSPRGLLRGGETLPVAVTPYRQYQVRIRPVGGDLMHFDNGARRVSVYPGNVASLAWTVKPVVAMFGRLVWPDGTPIGEADVIAQDALGHSDPQGYFLIETSPHAPVTIRAPDGRSCRATLTGAQQAGGYVALGPVICRDTQRSDGASRIAAK